MLLALALLLAAPAAEEKLDLQLVHRIKTEAFQNGQVMDHLFALTDVNGARLTASPGLKSAADWSVSQLQKWGASKPRLEPWGKFGRGWSVSHVALHLVSPAPAALVAVPKAWSQGTQGPVTGELVIAPFFQRHERDDASDLTRLAEHVRRYMQEQQGKLRGKIVLFDPPRDLDKPEKPPEQGRYDDPKLAGLAAAPDPTEKVEWQYPLQRIPREPKERAALFAQVPTEVVADFWERRRQLYAPLWEFLAKEGALAVLSTDDRGEGGLVFAESTGAWTGTMPPAWLVVAPEQYGRLFRLAKRGLHPKVEVDVRVAVQDDVDGVNVVAELPGTGKHKDEVVMLGAHLDSWHGSTGATDNAAGSAVMLEAVRILKALNVPLDRTVRIALWSGEEQGLLGSRGYVRAHFGDPVTMKLQPEHARLAAYFNLDNGGGRIRGVYLQGNDMVRPIFETWLAPFKDLGATTLTIRNTGGTDHLSYDGVGLPGFQFIQDPLDYSTRTHHSEVDAYDHVQAGDLMQASAIVATFVQAAANRAEMLPRKVLPKPLPERKAPSAALE